MLKVLNILKVFVLINMYIFIIHINLFLFIALIILSITSFFLHFKLFLNLDKHFFNVLYVVPINNWYR